LQSDQPRSNLGILCASFLSIRVWVNEESARYRGSQSHEMHHSACDLFVSTSWIQILTMFLVAPGDAHISWAWRRYLCKCRHRHSESSSLAEKSAGCDVDSGCSYSKSQTQASEDCEEACKSTASGDFTSDSLDATDPDAENKDESDADEGCCINTVSSKQLPQLAVDPQRVCKLQHCACTALAARRGHHTASPAHCPNECAAVDARHSLTSLPTKPGDAQPVAPHLDEAVHSARVAVTHEMLSASAFDVGCRLRCPDKSFFRSRSRTRSPHVILEQLALLDPSCVVVVRNISSLGLSAAAFLEVHFSQFGLVRHVWQSQLQRNTAASRGGCQQGLAFVVMEEASHANSALQKGREQSVLRATIQLSPFRKDRQSEIVGAKARRHAQDKLEDHG